MLFVSVKGDNNHNYLSQSYPCRNLIHTSLLHSLPCKPVIVNGFAHLNLLNIQHILILYTSSTLYITKCVFMNLSSSYDVTAQLTQEGAESGGECIPVVSCMCHSLVWWPNG